MDPLYSLGKSFFSSSQNKQVSLFSQDGTEVTGINESIYIRLEGKYIFPRDTPTNYRSKRGSGDFYPLDSIWFLLERKDSPYGAYMQEARKNGLVVVSLVDRKELVTYVEDIGKGVEREAPNSVDKSAPLPKPQSSFAVDAEPAALEEDTFQFNTSRKSKTEMMGKRVYSTDSLFMTDTSFKFAADIGKKTLSKLKASISSNIIPSSKPATPTSSSLMEDISATTKRVSERKEMRSQSKLQTQSAPKESIRNKAKIIIVPATPTAPLNMYNALQFLSENKYKSVQEAKSEGIKKQNQILFKHPKLGTIEIVDNTSRFKDSDWDRIIAVFALGAVWQFKGWKWSDPAELFNKVCGFVLEFEDELVGGSRNKQIPNWNVSQLSISKHNRTKDAPAILKFWSLVEEHLKKHRK